MRVLIVEDEPNLGRQLRATLEGAGYAVDLATDGEDGHYLGSTESYDAVILDLGLPGLDGIDNNTSNVDFLSGVAYIVKPPVDAPVDEQRRQRRALRGEQVGGGPTQASGACSAEATRLLVSPRSGSSRRTESAHSCVGAAAARLGGSAAA